MEKSKFLNIYLLCILMFIILGVIGQSDRFIIYYELKLNYSYGEISVGEFDIIFSSKEIDNKPGAHNVILFDKEGKILSNNSFMLPIKIWGEYFDSETGHVENGRKIYLNETEFFIFIPYEKEGNHIAIYNTLSIEAERIDVSMYADKRVDGETKGGVKDNKLIIKKEKLNGRLSLIIFLMGVIVLVVGIFYFIKKKNKRPQKV